MSSFLSGSSSGAALKLTTLQREETSTVKRAPSCGLHGRGCDLQATAQKALWRASFLGFRAEAAA